MFSISNKVAYDGQMVQGKPPSEGEAPPSVWYDVRGSVAQGHWIEEEGVVLSELLKDLTTRGVDPGQIITISPFRDVAKRLRPIGLRYGLDVHKTGTVHTAQGKEADVVVLVLGGNPDSPGAKAWAAAKPNLLNVAVSRARQRLYVIGDRASWRSHPYFADLAQHLPEAKRLLA